VNEKIFSSHKQTLRPRMWWPAVPLSADFPGRPLMSGIPEKKQVTPGKLIEKQRFSVRGRPRLFAYSRTLFGACFGAF
jgi:hypothetical protein